MAPSESSELPVDEYNLVFSDPYDIYTQPVIQVVTEESTGPVTFYVHKTLLIRHSKWFRDELEGQQSGNKIQLKDVDPETVKVFVDWLYKQEVKPVNHWKLVYRTKRCEDDAIVAAYIFADRFSISGFKSTLLQLAVSYFNVDEPGDFAIIRAFKDLPASSAFLQLLVDATWKNRDPEHFYPDDDDINLPTSFLIQVAKLYAQIARSAGHAVELREVDYTSD